MDSLTLRACSFPTKLSIRRAAHAVPISTYSPFRYAMFLTLLLQSCAVGDIELVAASVNTESPVVLVWRARIGESK